MADVTKKGLTPIGWLLVAGAGAYFFGSKERRDKTLDTIKGWSGGASGTTTDAKPEA